MLSFLPFHTTWATPRVPSSLEGFRNHTHRKRIPLSLPPPCCSCLPLHSHVVIVIHASLSRVRRRGCNESVAPDVGYRYLEAKPWSSQNSLYTNAATVRAFPFMLFRSNASPGAGDERLGRPDLRSRQARDVRRGPAAVTVQFVRSAATLASAKVAQLCWPSAHLQLGHEFGSKGGGVVAFHGQLECESRGVTPLSRMQSGLTPSVQLYTERRIGTASCGLRSFRPSAWSEHDGSLHRSRQCSTG